MYLLIPEFRAYTSKYQVNLHPTMYLLIPDETDEAEDEDEHLHPTMYLLIRKTASLRKNI